MRKYLVATHGKLADGFASSVSVLLGRKDLKTINAYLEDDGTNTNYIDDIKKFIDDIGVDDEGVIFTDIYGGSVNQKVVEQVSTTNKKVFIITQTNLAIILQILLSSEALSSGNLKKMISESTPQYIDLGTMKLKNQDEEKFF